MLLKLWYLPDLQTRIWGFEFIIKDFGDLDYFEHAPENIKIDGIPYQKCICENENGEKTVYAYMKCYLYEQ